MKGSTVLWGLLMLNVALAGVLVWKLTPENTAHAQAAADGDYVMVPARAQGATNGAIYMIDTRNNILGGFAYDEGRNVLTNLPPIDLNRVFAAAAGGLPVGGGRR